MTRKVRPKDVHSFGQAMTESILLLPIILFFVLGVLQMCQVGIALVMSQYAASSVARKAASDQMLSVSGNPDLNPYAPNVRSLMVVGMQLDDMRACRSNSGNATDPTAEMIVAVRSKVEAWPFFSNIVYSAVQNNYTTNGLYCTTMDNPGGFGPYNFSQSSPDTPAYFYVTGKAKVRLNYVP